MHTILLQAQGGNNYSFFILMGGMFLVMYFFMIRPQQKKQKEAKKFRENLKKGDEVISSGGIHGKIISVTDSTITLDIDRGTKIVIEKSSVSAPTAPAAVKKD
jgi:preprotein translocase subunit YajC